MPWDWKSRCCLSMCHAAFAIPTGRNSAWNPWSLRCAGNWAPWFRPIISMKFRPRSTICSASVAISLPAWARCASNPFFAWGTALPMGRRKSRDWPINKCGNGWRGKTSMPELLARGTLLRWMGWFALANALLLVFLILGPVLLAWPSRRWLSGLAIVLYALMLAVVVLDSLLWSQSRFHINGLTLQILG